MLWDCWSRMLLLLVWVTYLNILGSSRMSSKKFSSSNVIFSVLPLSISHIFRQQVVCKRPMTVIALSWKPVRQRIIPSEHVWPYTASQSANVITRLWQGCVNSCMVLLSLLPTDILTVLLTQLLVCQFWMYLFWGKRALYIRGLSR